jgi:hypothetical protein
MKEIKREPNLPAPTDCFGNEQPMATWYECPRCMQKSPLTRQWVGLTDEDIAQAMYKTDAIITGPKQFDFAKELEAKLREKNNG